MKWYEKAKRLMKEKGITQDDLIPVFDVKTRGAVGHYLNGRRQPDPDKLAAFANRLDCRIDDFFNDGEKTEAIVCESTDIVSERSAEYLPVNMGYFHLQAGVTGYSIEFYEDIKPPIFFHATWFHANGYKPKKLVACKIKGDSMEPRLFAGDVVIINTDDNTPIDGKVFAVNYEGELVIKRLIRDGGQWYLSSDNPDKTRHPNKICTADICITIGRVVYRQSSEI
jgi:phage repressor protein C with HTH and peptisase S24 domain